MLASLMPTFDRVGGYTIPEVTKIWIWDLGVGVGTPNLGVGMVFGVE